MKILIIVSFVLLGSITNAQKIDQKIDDIITDRPDQTESPSTVPKGFLQVELGGTYEGDKMTFGEIADAKTRSISAPSLLLRYGISDNVELRLGGEFTSSKTEIHYYQFVIEDELIIEESGLSPIILGTKIKMFEESGAWPEMGFLFSLGIPFDTDGPFQSKYISSDFRIAAAHTLSDRFSLSYNLGGEWDGNSSAATGIYTMALGAGITSRLSVFAELYGFLTQRETPDHRFDGGFTYLFAKNVQADLSGGIGITEKSPDFFVGAGISFRLPK
jgi:hypothetical protein